MKSSLACVEGTRKGRGIGEIGHAHRCEGSVQEGGKVAALTLHSMFAFHALCEFPFPFPLLAPAAQAKCSVEKAANT